MFIIPVIFRSGNQTIIGIQNLGTIVYDFLSIIDNIADIQSVSAIEKVDYFLHLSEDYYYKVFFQDDLEFSENLYLNLGLIVKDYLFKISYAQITSIALEDFLSARFLPDYHVIEYLAKEAQLDRYSVSKVLVALSNLLRDCQEYDVKQINAISLRIHKAIMNENKTVFVITEF